MNPSPSKRGLILALFLGLAACPCFAMMPREDPGSSAAFLPGPEHFKSRSTHSIPRLLAKKGLLPNPRLGLGVPAMGDTCCLVGTENHDGAGNFLLCLDANPEALGRDPILGQLPFQAPVDCCAWLGPRAAVATTREGRMHLVHLDDTNQMQKRETVETLHTDSIRQINANSTLFSLVASGGHDNVFKIYSWDEGKLVTSIPTQGTISSVHWQIPQEPTFTLEDGLLVVVDFRCRGENKLELETHNRGLYDHNRITQNTVLLGYEDGSIHCLDLRIRRSRPAMRHSGAVGTLEYHSASQRVLVGGTGSSSLWRIDPEKCGGYVEAELLTHLGEYDQKANHSPAFIPNHENALIDCSSTGQYSLIELD